MAKPRGTADPATSEPPFLWYEFFAGGGMARLGLGRRWTCAFANEWCPKKAAAYRRRFGPAPELKTEDVARLTTAHLPAHPHLVWASFPCQDLSLAGAGAGLNGRRSGAFWPFWRLMEGLISEVRKPPLIVLENVPGAVTSHGGSDFAAILSRFAGQNYRIGPMVMDAARFVPQSRPRLFLVAVDASVPIPARLVRPSPDPCWSPPALQAARLGLPPDLAEKWIWWNVPAPAAPVPPLSSLIEPEPAGVAWHSAAETRRLLALMSGANIRKVRAMQKLGQPCVGTVYRRTRPVRVAGEIAGRTQRAEVRFDGLSGCLRTPGGGSSRQTVLTVDGPRVRSRLLSPREAARLMGAPDDYPLPAKYSDAYHLFGDGLVVPVVSWLEEHLLRPLARASATP